MTTRDDRPALMTEQEAGAFLGLSQSTLEKLRRRGRGPKARRIGRLIRYLRTDIEDWLDTLPPAEFDVTW